MTGRQALDEQLRGLERGVTEMERLIETPIPTHYTRHISRFLTLWASALPLALWPSMGWATPAASVVIAYFVLGLEDVGAQMEQPFFVLPQASYCVHCNDACRETMRLASVR